MISQLNDHIVIVDNRLEYGKYCSFDFVVVDFRNQYVDVQYQYELNRLNKDLLNQTIRIVNG